LDNLFFNFLDKFESNLAISYSTNLYIIKNHKDGRLKNIINALEYQRYPTYGTSSSNQNSFDEKNYKIQFNGTMALKPKAIHIILPNDQVFQKSSRRTGFGVFHPLK
jgi:hypothetical protein